MKKNQKIGLTVAIIYFLGVFCFPKIFLSMLGGSIIIVVTIVFYYFLWQQRKNK
jgi:hypothetical protein